MAEYKDISKNWLRKEQDAKNAKEDAVIEAIIEDAQMEIACHDRYTAETDDR